MAHVLVKALTAYPCAKNGRQMVAAKGDTFELHAFAARTAQRRGKVEIIGGSATQKKAIKGHAKKQAAKAEAKAAKAKKQ